MPYLSNEEQAEQESSAWVKYSLDTSLVDDEINF